MKSSLRRLSFLALAVVAGASVFGLFWSAHVQAFTVGGSGGGSTGQAPCNATGNATMCYNNTTTVTNVPPATQSNYLSTGKYICGACPTSGS